MVYTQVKRTMAFCESWKSSKEFSKWHLKIHDDKWDESYLHE